MKKPAPISTPPVDGDTALFKKLGPEHTHSLVPVFKLRFFILTLDHNACRQMGDTDSRFRLVDMLAARAAGTVGIDP